jgi:hypothetical protein
LLLAVPASAENAALPLTIAVASFAAEDPADSEIAAQIRRTILADLSRARDFDKLSRFD